MIGTMSHRLLTQAQRSQQPTMCERDTLRRMASLVISYVEWDAGYRIGEALKKNYRRMIKVEGNILLRVKCRNDSLEKLK